MQASDLAQALALYQQLTSTIETRNAVHIDNLSSCRIKFRDSTPEASEVYTIDLAGEDLNDVTKVVRRQLLVDINQLTVQLEQLGVEL